MKGAATVGASDLHLRVNGTPMVRVNGQMRPLDPGIPPLNGEQLRHLIYSILTDDQVRRFEDELELDCSLAMPNVAQFRVNVLRTRMGVEAVMRVLNGRIPEPDAIGLTPHMLALAQLSRGLVLVTGPTGAGKTTTLACLIEQANRSRTDHIITVEDPIEYFYESKRCIVRQREVGAHTRSFPNALRAALREDPDILLVGEMRDAETIALAVTAAETGHLCFATLHTQDAATSITRIIDSFAPHQQAQIRAQLSASLRAVISQSLLPRKDGKGRIALREFMIVTPAIATLIRDAKTHLINGAIETGQAMGMIQLDRAIAEAIRMGVVDTDLAMARAHNPEQVRLLIGGPTAVRK